MDRKRVRVQVRTVTPDQNEIMPYSYVVFTDQTYHSLMEHYLDRTGMHHLHYPIEIKKCIFWLESMFSIESNVFDWERIPFEAHCQQ